MRNSVALDNERRSGCPEMITLTQMLGSACSIWQQTFDLIKSVRAGVGICWSF